MQTIHVAGGQIVCQAGDLEHNFAQIADLAGRAAAVGARVIVFPEGALNGYVFSPGNLETAVRADGPWAARLRELSRSLDIACVTGLIEASDEGRHVSQFITLPDGELLVNRKHRLTPTEQKAEMIAGPEERQVFELDGVRFACGICADSGIPDLRNKLAARGVNCYLASVAGGEGTDKCRTPEDLQDDDVLQQYVADMEKVCFLGPAMLECARHRMALVAVNMAAKDVEVEHYHPGHSSIVDSRGRGVALVPGEYVWEWQYPKLIHGEIVIQQPRRWSE